MNADEVSLALDDVFVVTSDGHNQPCCTRHTVNVRLEDPETAQVKLPETDTV